MGVSGISGNYSYNDIYTGSTKNPADIAIDANKQSQVNGYSAGTNNALDGKELLKTAEGGLESIADSLQSIRELSIRASSSILTGDDKQAIQDEISGHLSSIQDAAKGTEFNTMKLLDGSMADIKLATNPDGKGMEIKLANSTLSALGIDGYDVTKEVNIDKIDKAISKVNASRTNIGSAQKALEVQTSMGNTAVENLDDSADRQLEDMIDKVADDKKNRVMQEYSNFTLMSKLKQEGSNVERLLDIK